MKNQKTRLWIKVNNIARRRIFSYYQGFKKRYKTRADSKTIHSYITQHNATNLDGSSVLYAIKILLEKNLLKNTPTKGGDSYCLVSKDSSTAIALDINDTESNTQRPLQMRKYQN